MALQILNSKSAIFTKRSSIKIFLLFLVTFFKNCINSVNAQCWEKISFDIGVISHNSSPNLENLNLINTVSIVNDSIAYIGGSINSNLLDKVHLFKTINGGKNWEKLNIPFGSNLETIAFLKFTDRDTGWVIGDPRIKKEIAYKTTDGGVTWTSLTNINKLIEGYTYIRSAFLENAKTLWIICRKEFEGNSYGIFYTNDFGTTWSFFPMEGGNMPSIGLHVNSKGEGWSSSFNEGEILMKRTKGQFEFKNIPFKGYNFGYEISFKGDVGCFAMGDYYTSVAITKDYGKTWFKTLNYDTSTKVIVPVTWTVHVLDSLEILAGGFIINPYYSRPIMSKTRDGGKTWRDIKLNQERGLPLVGIDSYGRDFAIAVGDTNRVYIYRRPPAPICDLKILSNDTLKANELLTWSPASGCIGGYYLSIGTAPNKKDILDSVDIEDVLQYSLKNIQPKQSIYVSLSPYNDGGVAPPCILKKIYLEQCTVKTRLDTIIKPGTEINGIIYLQDTIITKVYKSTEGCDSLVNLYVDVLTSSQELETAFIQPLRVNPNPTSSNLQVSFQLKKATKGSLAISDKLGRIMWKTDQKEWNTGIQNLELDVSNYPSCVYQLIWNDKSGNSVVKWVKMN